MDDYDVDLFVIGGGSGGVRAARMAAALGARVALAEERHLGGTCVNVGCVPKKLLVYAAHFAEAFEDAAGFGWSVPRHELDWSRLIGNKDREIARLNGVYRRLLDDAGVVIHDARARLVDAHTVAIAGRSLRARHILLATGSWPVVPEIPGREHAITSNEAFFLERLPQRLVVVGGGYIAVEFAGIFNGLGVQTTLCYRGPLFLRGFDGDLRGHLALEMTKRGIELRFETEVREIRRIPDGLQLRLQNGESLETDTVMYATGRAPNTRDLGLDAAGVVTNAKGAVEVDGQYRSSVPSVFAIGDVTDRLNLTPVATAEGMALARTLFAGVPTTVDYDNVPTCVFSQPNLAAVGLSEEAARERGLEVSVYRSSFRPMLHTLSGRDERALVKLVVDQASDRVLGAHMVGPEAGEIIQGLAVAIKAGATKTIVDQTIGIHPTLAEEFVTLREAAGR